MHHHAALVGAVPMNCTSWALHDIAHADTLWLPAFITYPATSGFHLEYLPVLVMVPVCPRAGEEGNMIAHDAVHGSCELVHPMRK